MRDLKAEARSEAEEIKRLLSRYRLREAIERMMDFPQLFFKPGSAEFNSLRDYATELSDRFSWTIDPRNSSTLQAKDDYEDQLIRELNRLIQRMTDSVFSSTQSYNEGATPPAKMSMEFRSTVVRVENCYKDFGGPEFSLGPIDIKIKQGDVLALMGANASGKSTLLRMILGELAPSSGTVAYPGLPKTWTYRGRRSTIGYVPQFLPPWSGPLRENLQYYLATRGVRGAKNDRQVEYYLQRFRLSKYQHLNWSQISGGFKLRFALARELLSEPSLLILDEPLAHLDVELQFELLDIIRGISNRLWQPISVVFTSQHIYETERFCSKVAVLKAGKLLIHAPLADLAQAHDGPVFELEISVAVDALREALRGLSCQITGREPVYLVEFTGGFHLRDVVERLSAHAIYIKSIRDISSSSRTFFQSVDE